jgi:hypothetical protein
MASRVPSPPAIRSVSIDRVRPNDSAGIPTLDELHTVPGTAATIRIE